MPKGRIKMELKDFLNKVVVGVNGTRFYLKEITAPYISGVTVNPDEEGHHTFRKWPTINGDPFEKGYLVFEDKRLAAPFRAAYDAHCRTKDAYFEEFGYWMRRD
jgi:hypothetical protein